MLAFLFIARAAAAAAPVTGSSSGFQEPVGAKTPAAPLTAPQGDNIRGKPCMGTDVCTVLYTARMVLLPRDKDWQGVVLEPTR